MTHAKLLDHDHAEMDRLLTDFFQALDQRDAARAVEKLDRLWGRLAVHIRAEHLHLFPALLHLPGGAERPAGAPSPEAVKNATDKLRMDHDIFMTEIFAALKTLRTPPASADQSAAVETIQAAREKITTVKERLQQHNEYEEIHVYRWAERLLSPAALAALNDAMQKELANLPPRFRL